MQTYQFTCYGCGYVTPKYWSESTRDEVAAQHAANCPDLRPGAQVRDPYGRLIYRKR